MGSINKSHNEADGGILLFNGELILLYCDSVSCEIGGKESIKGRVYLTTHRLVVIVSPYRPNSPVKSLCAPFCAIVKCSVEQPVFSANYIEATVRDEADPSKTFSFKLKFSKGGAIELAMAMNRACAVVGRNFSPNMPPPPAYTPSPSASYYQAPPTVYAPGYNCGVAMPVQQFPDTPPIGFIYASSAPPPYPGLNGPAGQQQPPPPYAQPQQQQQQPAGQNLPQTGYPQQQQAGGYPQPQGGYPQQQPAQGYPTAQPAAGNYPRDPAYAQQPGAAQPPPPPPPMQGGYPQSGGYPQQTGYPQAPGGYPQQPPQQQPQGAGMYPDITGGAGSAPPSSSQPAQANQWPTAPSFNPNWSDEKKQP